MDPSPLQKGARCPSEDLELSETHEFILCGDQIQSDFQFLKKGGARAAGLQKKCDTPMCSRAESREA